MTYIVVTHGGTGSDPDLKDGTDRAAEAGMKKLRGKGSAVDAVVEACRVLEDDERFNAGTGSNLCFDGKSIEMDAAVTDSDRHYGAVSAIRDVRNPVLIARELMFLPNNILAGEGAIAFARKRGFGKHDPYTDHAREKWEEIIGSICKGEHSRSDCEWDLDTLRENWNYDTPFDEVFAQATRKRKEGPRIGTGDTIGAVATDGRRFAAAASTGGTITTLHGRVGDTPNLGAGVFAGEGGAIACTGNGDHILRARLATRIHDHLVKGKGPREAGKAETDRFEDWVDVFVVVVSKDDYAGMGNRDIAWSALRE